MTIEFMNFPFDFNSRRSAVMGTRGMVATSQPLAVAAGLEILAGGGNAADAAVAAAAALNVTEPTSTGIGGDCFALFFDSKTNQISALNGSGRAPAGLTLQRVGEEGFTRELPPLHPFTITVPGACAGWCDLVERHGRLEMSVVLEPAVRLAEQGFPVSPITAYFWDRGVKRQLSQALGGEELTIAGRAPRAGEIFRNPGLARTLRIVAEGGKTAFYHGEIAEAVAAAVQAAGGILTVDDMAYHQSTWEQPFSVDYRGFRVWECPPNGQGLAALLALNILEGFEVENGDPFTVHWLHLEIEALRLAFADARWYVTDPEFSPIPLDALLSKGYANQRRRLINHQRATLDRLWGTPENFSDTVYLTVIDGEGNACSFINSNYMGFGTGIVPSGYGFTLQNRGHNFDLQPDHPNVLAPGKRPYHTIIPSMVTREKDGSLYASYGVMGGYMQPQGHVQVISALVDGGLDPQAALERPRFCIADGQAGGDVLLEEGFPETTLRRLVKLGHPLKVVSGIERSIFGRGQIILRDAESRVLFAGSDPRADGCAMCL
ncbi:MAG: gamma-glutamyltransferase family protein [Anaerolineales bacterium]|nr:gamma-glutamyltransferase family protein [Anaerolineales bacterium]